MATRFVARQTIGRLPPPASRLTGKLAKDGGRPVRDVRFRPWANYHSGNLLPWFTTVGPAFRRIFLSGVEGLPQARQKQFAEQWAEYLQLPARAPAPAWHRCAPVGACSSV